MEKNDHIFLSALAKKTYQKDLFYSERAMNYLTTRVSKDSIKSFCLGFCFRRDSALKELSAISSLEKVKSLGIFAETEEGRIYDRFFNRIIFPINSAQGATLGFVARALEQSPFKYLNTEDGVFFKRSELFFGLDVAIPYIIREDFVFICEGLFDVIAMHEAGFKNCIASLGTSLTKSQLDSLRFFTSNIAILFDGDAAGQAGSMNAQSLAASLGFKVQTINLPVTDDPDSLYHEIGREPFRTFIGNSLYF